MKQIHTLHSRLFINNANSSSRNYACHVFLHCIIQSCNYKMRQMLNQTQQIANQSINDIIIWENGDSCVNRNTFQPKNSLSHTTEWEQNEIEDTV